MWRALSGTGLVVGVTLGLATMSAPAPSAAPQTVAAPAVTALGSGSPVAVLVLDTPQARVGDILSVSGDPSYDPDGFIVSYEFTFVNNTNPSSDPEVVTSEYPEISYTPMTYGNYDVFLVVVDDQGNASTAAKKSFQVVQVTTSVSNVNVGVGEQSTFTVFVQPPTAVVNFSIRSTSTASFVSKAIGGGAYEITVTGVSEGSAEFVVGNALFQIVSINVDVGLTSLPSAIAGTPTDCIAAGRSAVLDGSGSFDNDTVGPAPVIVQYLWKLINLSDPAQPPIMYDAGNSPVASVVLDIPGEYEATLTVIDNDGEVSESTSSECHVNITAVWVDFNPAAATMYVDDVVPLAATVFPETAASKVTFASSNTTIATISPAKTTISPSPVSVTGISAGGTTAIATVTNSLGTETCGSAPVTVNALPTPSFSIDSTQFDSDTTVTITATITDMAPGSTAILESSNSGIFSFGAGNSSAPVVAGENTLDVSAGVAGTVDITLVVTRGTRVWRIGGVQMTVTEPPPPPTQEIVITISPAGPFKVGDRVVVRAYLPGAPSDARIRLSVPGIGTVTGPASGTTVRGRVNSSGTRTVSALLVNSTLTVPAAQATMTVVGMRRLNADDQSVRLNNGSATVTFTPTTNPAGYNSLVEWSVSPSRGVSMTQNANGTMTMRFTRDGQYKVNASVGNSSRTIHVNVQPEPRRRR